MRIWRGKADAANKTGVESKAFGREGKVWSHGAGGAFYTRRDALIVENCVVVQRKRWWTEKRRRIQRIGTLFKCVFAIPGTDEERGVTVWREMIESATKSTSDGGGGGGGASTYDLPWGMDWLRR